MKGTLTEIEQYIVKSLVRNLKTISNSVRVHTSRLGLSSWKGWGESVGGLCLKFYPECRKFGTIVHLGSKA